MNNTPAFPVFPDTSHGHASAHKGMTIRDYFAAKAMSAVIINSDRKSTNVDEIDLWIGNYAYIVADAMMKAREK
jgi:hypothetical protein